MGVSLDLVALPSQGGLILLCLGWGGRRGFALRHRYRREEFMAMDINLAELREMHPRLPEDLVLIMATRAALGLQRNGHEAPVAISLDLERVASRGTLAWLRADLAALGQHDHNRVTEDGAEAVALALAHRNRGWRVVRRMQREEHADWLLEEMSEQAR